MIDFALAVEALMGTGVQYGNGNTYADLVRTWQDARPIPTLTQLQTAYDAFILIDTAARTERTGNLTAATQDQVVSLLTAADNRIAQITADRAALTAATTLAQVKPIVDRQLNAEAVLIADLKIILKALRWLV